MDSQLDGTNQSLNATFAMPFTYYCMLKKVFDSGAPYTYEARPGKSIATGRYVITELIS